MESVEQAKWSATCSTETQGSGIRGTCSRSGSCIETTVTSAADSGRESDWAGDASHPTLRTRITRHRAQAGASRAGVAREMQTRNRLAFGRMLLRQARLMATRRSRLGIVVAILALGHRLNFIAAE